jgi:hypothetical protein
MSRVSVRSAFVHGDSIMNVLMGMKQYHSVGDCFVPRSDMAIREMTHPLCPSDISPKYDMESFYDHSTFGGRIWGEEVRRSEKGR